MLHLTFSSALIALLVLSGARTSAARKTLDNFFDVQKGPSPGSCDAHLDILRKMFDEIQDLNDNAIEQLRTDKYDTNEETRKLAASIFGVTPSKTGKEPNAGLDLDRLNKVRTWYDDLEQDIENQDPNDQIAKPQLYCDSNFMAYVRGSDPSPGDPKKTVAQVLGKVNAVKIRNSWIYHVPTQNQADGGAYLLLPKNKYKAFPPDASGKPSYCAQGNTYAWTIEDEKQTERTQPMVILCPPAFTKKNINGGDIPDKLDLTAQDTGKVLDTMEPRMLTFFHELFHLTQEPDPLIGETSPDAKYRPAKKRSNGRPVQNWPSQKAGFAAPKAQTYGAVECMYVALWDLANPVAQGVSAMEATKNPESYAWFAVASYLSTHGASHQDWSSGACRDKGSPARTVTVIPG